MSSAHTTSYFYGKSIDDWQDHFYIDAKSFLHVGKWDPISLQNFITELSYLYNEAQRYFNNASYQYKLLASKNKKAYNFALSATKSKYGVKTPMGVIEADIHASMENELLEEYDLKAIKEYFSAEADKLDTLIDAAKQIAYLESIKYKHGA